MCLSFSSFRSLSNIFYRDGLVIVNSFLCFYAKKIFFFLSVLTGAFAQWSHLHLHLSFWDWNTSFRDHLLFIVAPEKSEVFLRDLFFVVVVLFFIWLGISLAVSIYLLWFCIFGVMRMKLRGVSSLVLSVRCHKYFINQDGYIFPFWGILLLISLKNVFYTFSMKLLVLSTPYMPIICIFLFQLLICLKWVIHEFF